MIISWPDGIQAKNEKRTQFHHVVDVVPTICEVTRINFPERINGVKQRDIAGVSMVYSFEDAQAEGTRKTQYFETGGHRAIYQDGWVAASFHGEPWILRGSVGFESNEWTLYNIEEDFSEATDLSERYPEKLAELIDIFDQEAKKYNVYPLDDRFSERATNPNRPSLTRGKTTFRYLPGTVRIPEGNAPQVYARSHTITVKLNHKAGDQGVIVACGGGSGGYTLFIKDNKLHYAYNFFHESHYEVSSTTLPIGDLDIQMKYVQSGSEEYGAGGSCSLYVNGKEVGSGTIEKVVPARFSATETLDIGMDLGSSVVSEYRSPFAYTGELGFVQFDLE
jgi:arylsulfatase